MGSSETLHTPVDIPGVGIAQVQLIVESAVIQEDVLRYKNLV